MHGTWFCSHSPFHSHLSLIFHTNYYTNGHTSNSFHSRVDGKKSPHRIIKINDIKLFCSNLCISKHINWNENYDETCTENNELTTELIEPWTIYFLNLNLRNMSMDHWIDWYCLFSHSGDSELMNHEKVRIICGRK